MFKKKNDKEVHDDAKADKGKKKPSAKGENPFKNALKSAKK